MTNGHDVELLYTVTNSGGTRQTRQTPTLVKACLEVCSFVQLTIAHIISYSIPKYHLLYANVAGCEVLACPKYTTSKASHD